MLSKLIRCIILVVVMALSACAFVVEEPTNQANAVCPALPKSFTEEDLIVTWLADYANGNFDTIVIREDGTYKQIFSSTVAGSSFESDWQKWWIEQRDSGYVRLHLESMRRCDDLESICQDLDGGLDPSLSRAIDYCEDTSIRMEREVVLIVTGTQYNVPKGILLRHAKISGSDWSYFFEYQPQGSTSK